MNQLFPRLAVLACCLLANDGLSETIKQGPEVSIGLRPGYMAIKASREDATLRAIAASPSADGIVAIAVGDHGAIWRSDDAGQHWRMAECPTRSTLHDVAFLSRDRLVAVGGGYEPVTGMSRGVVVISDDAGQSWRMAEATDTTRLHHLRVSATDLPAGMIEAIGDPGESSGSTRFQSYNAGETWVEDAVPATAGTSTLSFTTPKPSALEPLEQQHAVRLRDWIDVAALSPGGESIGLAVGDHGVIFRSNSINPLRSGATSGLWQSVRGHGRRTAVLFVASAAGTVPWSLLARETCQEHTRAGVVIDASGGPIPSQAPTDSIARTEQAATMLGAAYALDLAAPTDSTDSRRELLSHLRPSVVVLDESLPAPTTAAWRAAAAEARKRLTDSPESLAVILRSGSQVANDQGAAATRLANHDSLRGDAILPNMAALADDAWQDALLIVEPGRPTPPAATFATLSLDPRMAGQSRRGGSLTGALVLPVGAMRSGSDDNASSRRRLQLTTARLSQQKRLLAMLTDSHTDPAELASTLDAVVSTTAMEDRSRLLWNLTRSCFVDAAPAAITDVVVQRVASGADQPAMRRWAELKQQSRQRSSERNDLGVAASWVTYGQTVAPEERQSSTVAGIATAGATSFGPSHLSPFQIQPVGYQTTTAAVTPVLVPAVHQSAATVFVETATRVHWEYHPTVLAARRVHGDQGSRPAGQSAVQIPACHGRPRLDAQLHDPDWPTATWWLDGVCHVGAMADDDYVYLAVLIPASLADELTQSLHWLRLNIDSDHDPLTHCQLEASLPLRLSQDAAVTRWLVDLAPRPAAERSNIDSSPTWLVTTHRGQTIRGRSGAGDWQVIAEVAIPWSGWSTPTSHEPNPVPSWGLHVQLIGPLGDTSWDPFPRRDQFKTFLLPANSF